MGKSIDLTVSALIVLKCDTACWSFSHQNLFFSNTYIMHKGSICVGFYVEIFNKKYWAQECPGMHQSPKGNDSYIFSSK